MAKNKEGTGLTELREIYGSSKSTKAILDDFAGRTKNQRITKVDQILNRLRHASVQRWEVISLFRKLEELRFGKFVEGRRGYPSRFVWSTSQYGVGKAAQGTDAEIALVPGEDLDEDGIGGMREYMFPLRPGADATLQLPADLTQKEAERLSAFLKTLALPE